MKNIRKAFTLIELLIVIAILALFGATVVAGLGGCSISDGARVGTISKFTSKGIVNKSYEGELVLGGVRSNGSSMSANTWDFSVRDLQIVPEIEYARDHNFVVSLKYHQTISHNPFTQDTSYLVTGMSVITNL